MDKQVKLEDMDVKDIKAILYDQIVILEQTKNNIQILQNELIKRAQEKIPQEKIPQEKLPQDKQ
jgi:hypothetical protein